MYVIAACGFSLSLFLLYLPMLNWHDLRMREYRHIIIVINFTQQIIKLMKTQVNNLNSSSFPNIIIPKLFGNS